MQDPVLSDEKMGRPTLEVILKRPEYAILMVEMHQQGISHVPFGTSHARGQWYDLIGESSNAIRAKERALLYGKAFSGFNVPAKHADETEEDFVARALVELSVVSHAYRDTTWPKAVIPPPPSCYLV